MPVLLYKTSYNKEVYLHEDAMLVYLSGGITCSVHRESTEDTRKISPEQHDDLVAKDGLARCLDMFIIFPLFWGFSPALNGVNTLNQIQ